MNARISKLEKKFAPPPISVFELLSSEGNESEHDFKRRIKLKRETLIKRYGIDEFRKGVFLIIWPPEFNNKKL